MEQNESNIIIYNTIDGKASVVLYARDGSVCMNQNQLAELFDTSKQTVSYHIINILNERELDANSVVKKFFTTAADGKKYEVTWSWLSLRSSWRNGRRSSFRLIIVEKYEDNIDCRGKTQFYEDRSDCACHSGA